MNYQQLIAEHDAIEAAAAAVIGLVTAGAPRPAEAAKGLERLATLLRDHLAGEDDVIHATVAASGDSRHAGLAEGMRAELATLANDWENYLYRWPTPRITREWAEFGRESIEVLGRIHDRVAFETLVLYSLALHHGVVPVD